MPMVGLGFLPRLRRQLTVGPRLTSGPPFHGRPTRSSTELCTFSLRFECTASQIVPCRAHRPGLTKHLLMRTDILLHRSPRAEYAGTRQVGRRRALRRFIAVERPGPWSGCTGEGRTCDLNCVGDLLETRVLGLLTMACLRRLSSACDTERLRFDTIAFPACLQISS